VGGGGESWSQQAKIQASDVQLNSQFGVCVSISGDRLVVGANADDRTATDAVRRTYSNGRGRLDELEIRE